MNQPPKSFYSKEKLRDLQERGVIIPDLNSVRIGREISPEKISPGSTLHPFVRINGSKTKILSGAQIGIFGHATLKDSWIGENAVVGSLGPVTLKDTVVGPESILGTGVAEDSVFLGKESFVNDFTTGYGFRTRKGSLYEEDASSSQYTDTKMTILFPWSTLGSNINFCDVILAGGTGPEMGFFSEVGSGTIHYNFSVRGDKATASLFGDVTRGVFLDKERIFIGGNNSLIGPIQADFGVMTAAGVRITGSLSRGLNFGKSIPNGLKNYDPQIFFDVFNIVKKQISVLAELVALINWYKQIRISCIAQTNHKKFIYESGMKIVKLNFQERLSQLNHFIDRIQYSHVNIEKFNKLTNKEISTQKKLIRRWSKINKKLSEFGDFEKTAPDSLIKGIVERQSEGISSYTELIKNLPNEAKNSGTKWLCEISNIVKEVLTVEIKE